jgi:hypothetical protein
MNADMVAKLALEWWRAAAPRSKSRLESICTDLSGSYAGIVAADTIACAIDRVYSWEVIEPVWEA